MMLRQVFGCLAGIWSSSVVVAEDSASISGLQAAYLYNFTQFIEWPESAFKSADSSFTFCVLGVSPVYTELKKVSDYQYQDRDFTVVWLNSTSNILGCQLLFFSAGAEHQFPSVSKNLLSAPVLTVSTQPNFIQNGGMIGFVQRDDHLRFEVNRKALLKAGLTPRATLLEVAERVIGIDSDSSGIESP